MTDYLGFFALGWIAFTLFSCGFVVYVTVLHSHKIGFRDIDDRGIRKGYEYEGATKYCLFTKNGKRYRPYSEEDAESFSFVTVLPALIPDILCRAVFKIEYDRELLVYARSLFGWLAVAVLYWIYCNISISWG